MTAYNLHALSTRETNYEEYSEWRFFLFAFKFFFFFFLTIPSKSPNSFCPSIDCTRSRRFCLWVLLQPFHARITSEPLHLIPRLDGARLETTTSETENPRADAFLFTPFPIDRLIETTPSPWSSQCR